MLLHSLNKILLCKKFLITIFILLISIYLYPLFSGHLYIPVYDNLDSNVVWNKILAQSGKIFSPNNAIIPNMMNGLPRASYGSEFDLLLWLYYFFEPQTAFIINELFIHLIALFGSYLLLSKYIVPKNKYYTYLLIFTGSLYFTTLPFWSGSGASISSLPLTTYVLLDIKHNRYTKWHWIYLIVLPLYSSLVFVYMFYIIYAGAYWLYNALRDKSINWKFFGAIFLLGVMFLFKEYRLIYSMFIDNNFISHRVEFDVFFNANLFESYRLMLVKFLQGHIPHGQGLQQLYLIPISVIALLLGLSHRYFTKNESMIIWLLIILSFTIDIWNLLLVNKYSIPLITLLSLILLKTNPRYQRVALLILFILFITFLASLFQYKELKWLIDYIPLLKSLNIVRLYLIEPLLLLILLIYSAKVYLQKLHYSPLFIFIFILAQFNFALEQSFYQTKPILNYLTFNEYYAPKLFNKLKNDLKTKYLQRKLTDFKFINYGIEPAVAQYNNLYTVDGYCTNYPLSYKYKFRNTQNKILDLPLMKGNKELYDDWGSKVYLIGLDSRVEHYKYFVKSTIPPVFFNADIDGICALDTDFLLSSHPLKGIKDKPLRLINHYKDNFWQIWLYHVECNINQ